MKHAAAYMQAGDQGSSLRKTALVACLIWLGLVPGVSAGAVEPPMAPLIFEKPNTGQFEVIWFHPSAHRRTIGNLFDSEPSRFGVATELFEEPAVANSMSVQAPFALYRVATQLQTSTPVGGEPGDQLAPLDVQVAVVRDSLTRHPTDWGLALSDTVSGSLVELYPGVSFARADSLFVGFQWRAGSASAPRLSLQDSLGPLAPQEIVYRDNNVDHWFAAGEIFGVELDLLGWKPSALTEGSLSGWSDGSLPEFTVWYTSDSTRPIDNAYASSVITSETFSWVSDLRGAGYVMLCAVDSAGAVSDTIVKPLNVSSFGNLSFSHTQLTFTWSGQSAPSITMAVTNKSVNQARIWFESDYPDLQIDTSDTYVIGGNKTVFPKVKALAPPQTNGPVEASLYVYNDRGWPPVRMRVLLQPDIQTSVEDEEPIVPLSFEVSDVFPNPSRGLGYVRITAPSAQTFHLEVFNVLGQLISSDEFHFRGEAEIPVRLEPTDGLPLAAGVYFLRITSGDESLMRKFMLLK
ncbi:MAG TPA: T9SS type A sorting domain-containing protein [candidate division Zixibacteria bacterium]|nr:T9SS type A sorting domain-containing protein [candidate division Zixibacteria bacterium]